MTATSGAIRAAERVAGDLAAGAPFIKCTSPLNVLKDTYDAAVIEHVRMNIST